MTKSIDEQFAAVEDQFALTRSNLAECAAHNRGEILARLDRGFFVQTTLNVGILCCMLGILYIEYTVPVHHYKIPNAPLSADPSTKPPEVRDTSKDDWTVQPCQTCNSTGKVLYNGAVYQCPACKGFKSFLQQPVDQNKYPGNPRE